MMEVRWSNGFDGKRQKIYRYFGKATYRTPRSGKRTVDALYICHFGGNSGPNLMLIKFGFVNVSILMCLNSCGAFIVILDLPDILFSGRNLNLNSIKLKKNVLHPQQHFFS